MTSAIMRFIFRVKQLFIELGYDVYTLQIDTGRLIPRITIKSHETIIREKEKHTRHAYTGLTEDMGFMPVWVQKGCWVRFE